MLTNGRTMRAAVCHRYGGRDVLEFLRVTVPTPSPEEVLVKVRATTVNSSDRWARSMSPHSGFAALGHLVARVLRPRKVILGSEFAGDVVAVGANVRQFSKGERVFGCTGTLLGCHAEYVCVHSRGTVASMPPNLSYIQAAALLFGGLTMLDFYSRGGLKAGDRVLVNGAAGAVGTAAVQLARAAGAHVSALCRAGRDDDVIPLGVKRIVDAGSLGSLECDARYDLVVDTVGTAPFAKSAPLLAPGGRLLLVLASVGEILRSPWNSFRSGISVVVGPVSERVDYIHTLRELAASGSLCPVIDRAFHFEDFCLAHEYVEAGHKLGSVAVHLN